MKVLISGDSLFTFKGGEKAGVRVSEWGMSVYAGVTWECYEYHSREKDGETIQKTPFPIALFVGGIRTAGGREAGKQ